MNPRGARFVAALGAFLIRPLVWSVRIETTDHAGLLAGKLTRPVIWAFWHNRLFLIPFIFRKYFPQTRGAALTSRSKDGEILAAYIGHFGIESVRGSSSRGGRAALLALKRVLNEGAVAAITPDGPRGPCYSLQPGILKLAQLTGAVILPVHIRYSSAWRLQSWDRFIIPKPFSRAELIFDVPHEVPRTETDEGFEVRRAQLEAVMKAHGEAGERSGRPGGGSNTRSS